MDMTTKAGTPYYVAPQVLSGAYDEKCDIWSCGVIAYILLCGYPPFYGDKDEDILRRVRTGKFEFPSPDWDNISDAAKSFITSMLTMDPKQRPTAEMALEHPFLRHFKDEGHKRMVPKDFCRKLKSFTGVSKLKKMVLTLIAQQLSDESIKDLQEIFLSLDTNQDGQLSIQEITEGMKQASVALPDDLEKILGMLDTDKSGSVDYLEFVAATLQTKDYMKKEVLWAAFRKFDKNGDGKIDKRELTAFMKQADASKKGRCDPTQDDSDALLRDMIDKTFSEADINQDGVIDFSEFEKMMERPGPSVSL